MAAPNVLARTTFAGENRYVRAALILGSMGMAAALPAGVLAQDRETGQRLVSVDPHAPVESEPPPPDAQRAREADITPTLPLASAAGWILAPEPAPSSRQERGEEALERYLDEALGQDRLEVLGADAWYQTVARAMRRRFDPDLREVERRRRSRMNAAGVVADEMARYAPGPERPQDPPGTPPPELSSLDRQVMDLAEWRNFLNAPVTWYRVEVRVTYNPEGVLSAAWVTRSSGYPSLDDDALSAVRDAAENIPLPPERITEGRDAIQADWLFEAGDVATNWAEAGCVEDPVRGGLQCAALGRGIVRTRVGLLRIVDATRDTFEERRAARNRNRRRLRP